MDIKFNVYFSSVPCYYKHVEGQTIPFEISQWQEQTDEASLALVLSRNGRLLQNGHSEPDVVVPAIPAQEIMLRPDQVDPNLSCAAGTPLHLQAALSKIPPCLRSPLIKVPAPVPGAMDDGQVVYQGYASGVRSGLIQLDDGQWYRLKGCGNNADGFTVRSSPSTDPRYPGRPWRDIRGCAFPHTALRELAVSSRLDPVMRSFGVPLCNESVAMSVYSGPEQNVMGAQFPTACIVQKTIGDRRLGSHVFAGLEILMPQLINQDAVSTEALLAMFPPGRPGHSVDDLSSHITTQGLVGDLVLAESYKYGDADTRAAQIDFSYAGGLAFDGVPRDTTCLSGANISDPLSCVNQAFAVPPADFCPVQYLNASTQPMAGAWKAVWDEARASIAAYMTGDPQSKLKMSPLSYLFSRLGFDAGRSLRGLHAARYSWGTYQDAMCHDSQWHCNAHANNLVVVSENLLRPGEAGCDALLSMLDLDMAFSEESFVDMKTGSVGYVKEAFSQLLWYEQVNLMDTLVNNDSTSGVPRVAQQDVLRSNTPKLMAIKSTLWDSLILSFLGGYTGDSDKYPVAPFDPELHRVSHCILRLCIAVMADFIA